MLAAPPPWWHAPRRPMSAAPLILVSNDDGIHSDGPAALADALAPLGDVVVVAPDREQSAVSHALTLHRPLRIDEVAPDRYTVDGTPTDCVNLAINAHPARAAGAGRVGHQQRRQPRRRRHVLGHRERGHGGHAARRAVHRGVAGRARAVRLHGRRRRSRASSSSAVLRHGLPPDTLLNVNVPAVRRRRAPRGVALTRMGKRRYGDAIVEKVDPRGRKYYWIGGEELSFVEEEGTDFHAVSQGRISVTPIHLDLTNYASFDALAPAGRLVVVARVPGPWPSSARARTMVAQQLAARGMRDAARARRHARACRAIAFVPPELATHAYDDTPLPIGERPDDLAALHGGAHERGARACAARTPRVLRSGPARATRRRCWPRWARGVVSIERIPALALRAARPARRARLRRSRARDRAPTARSAGRAERTATTASSSPPGAPQHPATRCVAQLASGRRLVAPDRRAATCRRWSACDAREQGLASTTSATAAS